MLSLQNQQNKRVMKFQTIVWAVVHRLNLIQGLLDGVTQLWFAHRNVILFCIAFVSHTALVQFNSSKRIW